MMSKNEIYAMVAAAAVVAYALGLRNGRAAAATGQATYDPLAWLNGGLSGV